MEGFTLHKIDFFKKKINTADMLRSISFSKNEVRIINSIIG